ncbi:hypothetical protein CGC21_1350 [Leishmania donovani]|uniref:IQ calmodulin-binding motif family protein n=1 Tax=Leishmania donovani TaxID=5661 RepID=A0A504XJE0_LEIDO|nr:hypothetical protein CGC21_1350 [Leishmania donovani]
MEIDSLKIQLTSLLALHHDDDANEDDIVFATLDYIRGAHTVAQMLLLEGRFPELQRCLNLCQAAFGEIATDPAAASSEEAAATTAAAAPSTTQDTSGPLSERVKAVGSELRPSLSPSSVDAASERRRTSVVLRSAEDHRVFSALASRTAQLQTQLEAAMQVRRGRDANYYLHKLGLGVKHNDADETLDKREAATSIRFFQWQLQQLPRAAPMASLLPPAPNQDAWGRSTQTSAARPPPPPARLSAPVQGERNRSASLCLASLNIPAPCGSTRQHATSSASVALLGDAPPPPSPPERGIAIGRKSYVNRWKAPKYLPPLVTEGRTFCMDRYQAYDVAADALHNRLQSNNHVGTLADKDGDVEDDGGIRAVQQLYGTLSQDSMPLYSREVLKEPHLWSLSGSLSSASSNWVSPPSSAAVTRPNPTASCYSAQLVSRVKCARFLLQTASPLLESAANSPVPALSSCSCWCADDDARHPAVNAFTSGSHTSHPAQSPSDVAEAFTPRRRLLPVSTSALATASSATNVIASSSLLQSHVGRGAPSDDAHVAASATFTSMPTPRSASTAAPSRTLEQLHLPSSATAVASLPSLTGLPATTSAAAAAAARAVQDVRHTMQFAMTSLKAQHQRSAQALEQCDELALSRLPYSAREALMASRARQATHAYVSGSSSPGGGGGVNSVRSVSPISVGTATTPNCPLTAAQLTEEQVLPPALPSVDAAAVATAEQHQLKYRRLPPPPPPSLLLSLSPSQQLSPDAEGQLRELRAACEQHLAASESNVREMEALWLAQHRQLKSRVALTCLEDFAEWSRSPGRDLMHRSSNGPQHRGSTSRRSAEQCTSLKSDSPVASTVKTGVSKDASEDNAVLLGAAKTMRSVATRAAQATQEGGDAARAEISVAPAAFSAQSPQQARHSGAGDAAGLYTYSAAVEASGSDTVEETLVAWRRTLRAMDSPSTATEVVHGSGAEAGELNAASACSFPSHTSCCLAATAVAPPPSRATEGVPRMWPSIRCAAAVVRCRRTQRFVCETLRQVVQRVLPGDLVRPAWKTGAAARPQPPFVGLPSVSLIGMNGAEASAKASGCAARRTVGSMTRVMNLMSGSSIDPPASTGSARALNAAAPSPWLPPSGFTCAGPSKEAVTSVIRHVNAAYRANAMLLSIEDWTTVAPDLLARSLPLSVRALRIQKWWRQRLAVRLCRQRRAAQEAYLVEEERRDAAALRLQRQIRVHWAQKTVARRAAAVAARIEHRVAAEQTTAKHSGSVDGLIDGSVAFGASSSLTTTPSSNRHLRRLVTPHGRGCSRGSSSSLQVRSARSVRTTSQAGTDCFLATLRTFKLAALPAATSGGVDKDASIFFRSARAAVAPDDVDRRVRSHRPRSPSKATAVETDATMVQTTAAPLSVHSDTTSEQRRSTTRPAAVPQMQPELVIAAAQRIQRCYRHHLARLHTARLRREVEVLSAVVTRRAPLAAIRVTLTAAPLSDILTAASARELDQGSDTTVMRSLLDRCTGDVCEAHLQRGLAARRHGDYKAPLERVSLRELQRIRQELGRGCRWRRWLRERELKVRQRADHHQVALLSCSSVKGIHSVQLLSSDGQGTQPVMSSEDERYLQLAGGEAVASRMILRLRATHPQWFGIATDPTSAQYIVSHCTPAQLATVPTIEAFVAAFASRAEVYNRYRHTCAKSLQLAWRLHREKLHGRRMVSASES